MKRWCESPSSISTYLTCPKKYQFKYMHKLPDPVGPAAVFGRDFHQAAYDSWETQSYEHKDVKISQMLEAMYAHDEVSQLPHNKLVRHDNKNPLFSAHDILARGESICEYKMDVQCGTQKLFGYIDLVLPNNTIVDFKTSKRKFTEEKIASALQHFAYTYGARRLGLSKVDHFLYIVVGTGTTPFVQVINISVSEEILTEFERQFNRKIIEIDSDLFPMQSGRHCSWCPYKGVCPAFNPNSPYTSCQPIQKQ